MSGWPVHNNSTRPRVGLINADDAGLSKLGHHRPAATLDAYTSSWALNETDILVLDSVSVELSLFKKGCHVLSRASSVGFSPFYDWIQSASKERELRINPEKTYEAFHACSEQLAQGVKTSSPLDVIDLRPDLVYVPLVKTDAGRPVVAIADLAPGRGGVPRFALIVPGEADLGSWYSAFLEYLHEVDDESVPLTPPRLADPKAWATSDELRLHEELDRAAVEAEVLRERRIKLESELSATQAETNEKGQRRMLFEDGGVLVAAVIDCLRDLGFEVEDADAPLLEGEPKREDLRVRDPNHDPSWVAIVEVKGYRKGVKTSDARQIIEQSKHYFKNHGDHVVWWVVNPHRTSDPATRPPLDANVAKHAKSIGAVLIPTADLYLAWRDCQLDEADTAAIRAELTGSSPGLWARSASPETLNGDVQTAGETPPQPE